MAACAHGPHEIRGAVRNDLVKALADLLPQGTIHFNAAASSIKTSATGAHGRRACLRRQHPRQQAVVLCVLMQPPTAALSPHTAPCPA